MLWFINTFVYCKFFIVKWVYLPINIVCKKTFVATLFASLEGQNYPVYSIKKRMAK